MRIVAGRFRRRKLLTNPGLTTRPMTDRVKEALFARIADQLEDARVADVFAGTGTLGLESLSRGAERVVFVEADRKAHELLERNVANLGVASEAFCWKTDVMRCSYRPKGRDAFYPYDVIFFDPPYRLVPFIQPGDSLYKSIERLTKDSVSSENATLVFRTPESAEFQLPDCWHLEDTIKASRMAIFLFQKKSVRTTDENPT